MPADGSGNINTALSKGYSLRQDEDGWWLAKGLLGGGAMECQLGETHERPALGRLAGFSHSNENGISCRSPLRR
jgi:hypothetical protein